MKRIISIVLVIILLSSCISLTVFAVEDNSYTSVGTEENLAPITDNGSEIVSVSAGYNMSTVVRSDGSVWALGGASTTFQGLAVGEYVNASTMIASRDTKNAKCSHYYNCEISYYSGPSSYYTNTALLKNDNSLWMYGGNERGAIGNGKTDGNTQKIPYKVLENVIDYDVAGYRSAAVTADGKLYMWGYNKYGQIGNNSTETVYSPVEVLEDVVSVSLSGGNEHYYNANGHSAAITADGSLWMWGCNKYGQLGDGTTENSYVPKKITDNVKQVSLGESFTMVLKTDGTVWTCGNNSSGQLAKGTIQSYTTDKITHGSSGSGYYIDEMWPTNVPDADKTLHKVVDLEDEDIIYIEAGYASASALSSNGYLWMWGANSASSWGQSDCSILGNGSTSTVPEPILILRNVKMVSLGYQHAIAVKYDDSLWSWGCNYNGQVGDSTTENRNRPVEIKLGQLNVDFYVEDVGTKQQEVIWDDNYLQKDGSIYNNDLAIDGIILSEATYSNSKVLSQYGFKLISNGLSNDSVDKPGYLAGYKVMYDYGEPKVVIIMAIRGTKSLLSEDALTDVKSIGDGFNGPTEYCYDIMKSVRSKIATELGNLGLSSSKKNTKVFVTGHSLGGACAGKMALKMQNDGLVYPSNLYVYTYAAPNYTNLEEKLDSVEDLPSIYNIVHNTDLVPQSPQFMSYYWLIPITLYKAGHTLELSIEGVSDFFTHIYNLYGQTPWDINTTFKAHKTAVYLALVKGYNDKISSIDYSKKCYRLLSVHCPVDLEVFDNNNELCATSSGETVDYPKESGVRIMFVGDETYIELPDNSFTVRYVGNETGQMSIEDQSVNAATGEIEQEKEFDNIAITEGKQFLINVSGNNETENTELYVVDEEGDNIRSVDQSGNETELAKYDLNEADISMPTDKYVYTGSQVKPLVSVGDLTEGVDYRVIYNDSVDIGAATLTVKGINEYRGRFTIPFTICGNGDVDGDGEISSNDATFFLRLLVEYDVPEKVTLNKMNGDVDGNKKLEAPDVTFLQRFLVDYSVPYPIGESFSPAA